MGRFFLFLLALFPLFGGLALSTQNFAKLVHYDARFLGSPLLDLTTPFYSPLSLSFLVYCLLQGSS